jgi:hypothetical protein
MYCEFSRKPQCWQSVAYAQYVGKKDPFPPSWQRVSPKASASVREHVLAQRLKGNEGGGGDSGATYGGGEAGGGGAFQSPVTVKARSSVRCSAAQLRAHDCSPSSSPGQVTERWLCRRLRSIVRALTSRLTSADAWPRSAFHVPSAPPSVCSPSAYEGSPWKVSEKM